jgi:hypothetical protein
LPVRFAELAPRRAMELRIYDVAAESAPNWGIEALEGSAVERSVTVSVRGYGPAGGAARRLILEQNGQVVREEPVTLGSNGRASLTFRDIDLAAGPNRVRARLAPADGLALDDARYLVLERPEPRPALLFSGQTQGRDTLFLDSALQTLTELELELAQATPGQLAEQSFTNQAFVVVTDAGALTSADSETLGAYVENGGSVLLAFGPRSNSLTRVPLTEHGVGALTAAAGQDYQRVGLLDLQHPALERAAALRNARFFRYAEIAEQPGDVVLARLEQGQPLLLERAVGNGRVLVFASSLDREWTDLPLQPVYVPFIAGVASYLAGGSRVDVAELGSTLALRQLGLPGGQIFDPEGRRVLGIGGLGDEIVVDQVGFYEALGGGVTELVAVNLDPRESDLQHMDDTALERWREFSRPSAATAAAEFGAGREPEPWPLWPWLLLGLVVAASMESVVGNWHLRVRRGLAT